MKKYATRISAVLLALLVIFFGGRGILQIAANSQADKDINRQLLGSSSLADKDTNHQDLGSSGADEQPDAGHKLALGASQVALGYSMGTFGVHDVNSSIEGILPVTEYRKIVIVPGPNGSAYQSYPGTPVGMAEALMNLYTNGNNKDFTIYIGTAIVMPPFMGAEVPAAVPTALNISFSALEGKVGTLAFVANYNDPIDHKNTTATTTTVGTISFPTKTYFGSNVLMRNISYGATNVYMMGHSLTLGYGSYFNLGAQFFGGSEKTPVTGNPTITLYSTGSGLQSYQGGGETASSSLTGNASIVVHDTSITAIDVITPGNRRGTHYGNTSLVIYKTSAVAISKIYGGNTTGTMYGDINITIHNTAGPITALYGSSSSGTVTGDVTTTIHNTGGAVGTFVGGPYHGTHNGNITTVIHNMGGTGEVSIFAGGYGAPSDLATIDGNVSTTINSLGTARLTQYVGGTMYGDVSGSITNVFRGTGRFSAPSRYYGGSNSGNIGAGLPAGSTAISNDFDSSQFTIGSVAFAGANANSGTIIGHIKNKATAGNVFDKGAIYSFSGGAGEPSRVGSNHGGDGTYDGMTPEAVLIEFMKMPASKHKIYGNIDNEITQGILSYATDESYTRSAGFSGYVEGDITTRIGTEGKVSSNYGIKLDFREKNNENTRGNGTGYDIVGGGGSPGYFNNIYIKGNTHLELSNIMARWTYGGNFSGLLEGNSTIMLHNGVVDTLEGTGFNNQQQWGNSFAHMLGGQVDWFLSGGGWNDRHLYGNAAVTVEGGTVNASMGGTFGSTAEHYIHGDTTILVTGGDFSGDSRANGNGFSGGATYLGTVYGNTSVTLDLRHSTVPFRLSESTPITGGRCFNAAAGSYLGTDANNTIELNIFTKSGSDVLNGASIYGDGSIYAASTRSGKITVNIDAPGSSVGTFYATQYSNISGTNLLRDVTFNIYNLKSVAGLSGGRSADNFTNTNASTSVNKSTININPTPLAGETTKNIAVVDGIVNFTEFNINNAIMEVSGTGGIKNGSGVTAANHGTTYHQFGNINITGGGGFKISNTALVAGSMLTVDGKASLTSPSGTGKLIISDLTIGADDSIHWTRNGGSALESVTGNWYGANRAYKVITFNPDRTKAQAVTPYNFTGQDELGKLYLGDNEDSSNASNGHGIAIPGTRVEFSVVGGAGTISHNVDKVLSTATPPLNGASNQDQDAQTTSGWLNFSDSFNGAKLTFTPDGASGSWLKNVRITRSDGNVSEITEVTHSNPVEWPVPAKGYSYVVEVTYTNVSELSGRSVMISESEAKAIATAEEIMSYQEINGRPFLIHGIDAALIAEMNKPLGEGVKVRSHKIAYTVGTLGNTITKYYDIGIVPDTAVIEKPNRRAAIDANDATMMLAVANGMTEVDLNTNYTHPMAYLPDGTMVTPTIDGSTIGALHAMTDPGSVNATYSYSLADPPATVSKTVVVLVIPDGKLALLTVPPLDFGQRTIPSAQTQHWKPTTSTLVVEDSRRVSDGFDWEVTLRVSDLVAGTEIIPAHNVVYTNTTATNGLVGVFPLDTVTPVWKSTTKEEDNQTMTWAVSGTEGFSINLGPSLKLGAYTGTATWSVQKTP